MFNEARAVTFVLHLTSILWGSLMFQDVLTTRAEVHRYVYINGFSQGEHSSELLLSNNNQKPSVLAINTECSNTRRKRNPGRMNGVSGPEHVIFR